MLLLPGYDCAMLVKRLVRSETFYIGLNHRNAGRLYFTEDDMKRRVINTIREDDGYEGVFRI